MQPQSMQPPVYPPPPQQPWYPAVPPPQQGMQTQQNHHPPQPPYPPTASSISPAAAGAALVSVLTGQASLDDVARVVLNLVPWQISLGGATCSCTCLGATIFPMCFLYSQRMRILKNGPVVQSHAPVGNVENDPVTQYQCCQGHYKSDVDMICCSNDNLKSWTTQYPRSCLALESTLCPMYSVLGNRAEMTSRYGIMDSFGCYQCCLAPIECIDDDCPPDGCTGCCFLPCMISQQDLELDVRKH